LDSTPVTATDKDSNPLATEIHYKEEAFYRLVEVEGEDESYYEELEDIPFVTVDTSQEDNDGVVTAWSFM